MQHVTGEILTEEAVLNRLEEEENSRQVKKDQGKKTAGRGRNKSALKRKNKISVDDLFLEALASDENLEEAPETSGNQVRSEDATEIMESVGMNEECDEETAVHVTEANNNLVNLSKLEECVTYVLAMYEGSCFPGLVSKLNKKSVEVSCMAKNGLFGWRWPIQPDLHAFPPEDLVAVIEPPRALNKRNNYSRP